jgi:hypothetical protein
VEFSSHELEAWKCLLMWFLIHGGTRLGRELLAVAVMASGSTGVPSTALRAGSSLRRAIPDGLVQDDKLGRAEWEVAVPAGSVGFPHKIKRLPPPLKS